MRRALLFLVAVGLFLVPLGLAFGQDTAGAAPDDGGLIGQLIRSGSLPTAAGLVAYVIRDVLKEALRTGITLNVRHDVADGKGFGLRHEPGEETRGMFARAVLALEQIGAGLTFYPRPRSGEVATPFRDTSVPATETRG